MVVVPCLREILWLFTEVFLMRHVTGDFLINARAPTRASMTVPAKEGKMTYAILARGVAQSRLLMQHGACRIDDTVRTDRFGEIVIGPWRYCFLGSFDRRITGNNDDCTLGPVFLDRLEDCHAIHSRHAQIKQDHIERMLSHYLQCIFAIFCLFHVTVFPEKGSDMTEPDDFIIIYQKKLAFPIILQPLLFVLNLLSNPHTNDLVITIFNLSSISYVQF